MYEKSCDPRTRPSFIRVAPAPRTPANQKLPSGVEISTLCEAVSTREIAAIVPGLLELKIYRRIYDLGMGSYPFWVTLAHAGSKVFRRN